MSRFQFCFCWIGHKSHINIELSDFCRENNIILFSFPPNATHGSQAIDSRACPKVPRVARRSGKILWNSTSLGGVGGEDACSQWASHSSAGSYCSVSAGVSKNGRVQCSEEEPHAPTSPGEWAEMCKQIHPRPVGTPPPALEQRQEVSQQAAPREGGLCENVLALFPPRLPPHQVNNYRNKRECGPGDLPTAPRVYEDSGLPQQHQCDV
ncbi:hypothetical protein PR048_018403 [Dryococelus australis]|uniref:Transposase n=1 Tax=Dryococelus australis TaxID=614101 RepID=A0ABQ9HCD5_9NEOP|nr:hypothetical protein PR048_018403 [Dryococelus australis]